MFVSHGSEIIVLDWKTMHWYEQCAWIHDGTEEPEILVNVLFDSNL